MTVRTDQGRFVKGHRSAPATEFKPGQHWRPRKPHWDRPWMVREYVTLGRTISEIAVGLGIRPSAVEYWMNKHAIPARSISEIRATKHWGASGSANPMFGKRGAQCASWRGGITAERQAFHGSTEWRDVSRAVWQRDRGTCRRCSLHANDCENPRFDVHHIVPFEVTALRAAIDNLVLLCRSCHRFVHSKKNLNREWMA